MLVYERVNLGGFTLHQHPAYGTVSWVPRDTSFRAPWQHVRWAEGESPTLGAVFFTKTWRFNHDKMGL